MTNLFSKRCKKLLDKKELIVSIPIPVRRRILKSLYDNNEHYSNTTTTGWHYTSSIIEDIPHLFESEHGIDMKSYNSDGTGEIIKDDFDNFILRGIYPPYLFDVIELFYKNINDEKKLIFQSSINEIMNESDLMWRLFEGEIFPINSVYVNEVIIKKTFELIKDIKFFGALKEFKKARTSLINNDYEGAINNANLAVESVIKGILNVKKAKPGELFRMLIDSGLIPNYYNGFLKSFEENILRCVAIMRNEELGVGHGKGASDDVIPPELANFAVNMSGVIINFLIERILDNKNNLKENNKNSDFSDEDMPF
jgi:hypothetical protein